MMKTLHLKELMRRAGWTLTEVLVATSISTMLCAGLITAVISLQKSFLASRHHIVAQSEQMRVLDSMGLDLRRAISVIRYDSELVLKIPDFYEKKLVAGVWKEVARNPSISAGKAVYGPAPRTIRYYKSGSVIYREDAGVASALAKDVTDFAMHFDDENKGQSLTVTLTFVPKYRLSGRGTTYQRASTTTHTSVLLRNRPTLPRTL